MKMNANTLVYTAVMQDRVLFRSAFSLLAMLGLVLLLSACSGGGEDVTGNNGLQASNTVNNGPQVQLLTQLQAKHKERALQRHDLAARLAVPGAVKGNLRSDGLGETTPTAQNGRVVDVFTRWISTSDAGSDTQDEAITYVLYSFLNEKILDKTTGGSLLNGQASSTSELWRLSGANNTSCLVLSLPFASTVALDFEQHIDNPAKGHAISLDFLVGTGDGVVGLVRLWDTKPRASDCTTIATDVVPPINEETAYYRPIDTVHAGGGPVEVLKSFRVDESAVAGAHLYDDYRVIVSSGFTPKCMKVEQKNFFGFLLPAQCVSTSVRLPSSGVLRNYRTSRAFYALTPNPDRANPQDNSNGVRDFDVLVARRDCGACAAPLVDTHLAIAYIGRASSSPSQLNYTNSRDLNADSLLKSSNTLVGTSLKQNFDQVASIDFGSADYPNIRTFDLTALRKVALQVTDREAVVNAVGLFEKYNFFRDTDDFGAPFEHHHDPVGSRVGFTAIRWNVTNPNQVTGTCGSSDTNQCLSVNEILPGVTHLKDSLNELPSNRQEFRLWAASDRSNGMTMQSPFYTDTLRGLPESMFTTRRVNAAFQTGNSSLIAWFSSDELVPSSTSQGLYVQNYSVDRVKLGGTDALIHLATLGDVNYGRDEGTQRQMINGGVYFCIEDGSRYRMTTSSGAGLPGGITASMEKNCTQSRSIGNSRNPSGFVTASASQLMVNQTYLAAPSLTRYSISPNTGEILLYYVSLNNAISVVNASDGSKRWEQSGPQGWAPLVNGRAASCWGELSKPTPPDTSNKKGFDVAGSFWLTALNITFSTASEGLGGPVAGFFVDFGLNLIEDALKDANEDNPDAAWLLLFNQVKINTACGLV